MSYEDQARTLAKNVSMLNLDPCQQCGGIEEHRADCPQLRPALLEAAAQPGEPLTLEQAKAVHVLRVLREKNWHKTNAAKALAIDRRTLYHLIERYGIKVP